jgi:hypothetical protein
MTSLTHPLRIDAVAAPGGGLIGMTSCLGKKQPNAAMGAWDRDLYLDLACVREWGAVAVVTLMEEHELAEYQAEHLGAAAEALGGADIGHALGATRLRAGTVNMLCSDRLTDVGEGAAYQSTFLDVAPA